jgi:hypothetical protein
LEDLLLGVEHEVDLSPVPVPEQVTASERFLLKQVRGRLDPFRLARSVLEKAAHGLLQAVRGLDVHGEGERDDLTGSSLQRDAAPIENQLPFELLAHRRIREARRPDYLDTPWMELRDRQQDGKTGAETSISDP